MFFCAVVSVKNNNVVPVQPDMLTVAIVAVKLSLSERKLRYAIADGDIKVRRFGDGVRIPRTEYERVLREGLPARRKAA